MSRTALRSHLRRLGFTLFAAGPLAMHVIPAPQASAASSFQVDTFVDLTDTTPGDGRCATVVGNCSLRAAVQEANARADSNVVAVPSGTYTLTIPGIDEDAATTGDLDITHNLLIQGAGVGLTTIDAAGLDRVIDAHAGIVTLREIIIVGGATPCAGSLVAAEAATRCVEPPDEADVPDWRDLVDDTLRTVQSKSGVSTRSVRDALESTEAGDLADVGGGIRALDAALVLRSVEVTRNVSGDAGGGVFTWESLDMADSAVRDNRAEYAGGVLAVGAARIARTRIEVNTAEDVGGVELVGSPLELTDSTVSANESTGSSLDGAFLYPWSGSAVVERTLFADHPGTALKAYGNWGWFSTRVGVVVRDSTFSGNSGEPVISARENVDLDLVNVTVTANAFTGSVLYRSGFFTDPGLRVVNSIVAANGAGMACGWADPITSLGHNVLDDATCAVESDRVVRDPRVAELADNGGFTLTHALLTRSPAIDAGDDARCAPADQRGHPRVRTCDAGAFEADDPPFA